MRSLKFCVVASAMLVAAVCASTSAMAQNPQQIEHARRGSDCRGCNLFQADFANIQLQGVKLAGSRLRQADVSAAVLTGVDLSQSDLRDLNAYGAVFTRSSLRGSNLTNASFVGAFLGGVDLRGAVLNGANFSGAEMAHASGLTQGQLSSACGDASTTLPPGLKLKSCR